MTRTRSGASGDTGLPSTRRSLLGTGAGVAVAAIVGCRSDESDSTPTAVVPSGSPVAVVPNFDDPTRWAGKTLRVAAWGGEVQTALNTAIWQPFARATGCTVQAMTSDYSQLSTSVAAGLPYVDVLIVDDVWAESAPDAGLVESFADGEIDRERFGPIAATEHDVPAYAYAMVDAFRRDAVLQKGEPENWSDWWDTGRYAGPRALPSRAEGSFEFALMADGVEPDKLYPLDVTRAVESLRRISGEIGDRWWGDGLDPITWMSNEQADLTAAWHYRVIAGQLDGRAIDLTWKDGLLVADSWVIAKGSPVRDVALDFLAYATSPEAQAALARAIPLGPVTPEAFRLLDPKVTKNLPTAPDAVGELVRRDRAWWAENRTAANDLFACEMRGGPCAQPVPTGTAAS